MNEYLKPKLKLIRKFIKKKRKEVLKNDIPYADFKVDEKPIIKTKEDEQLSFEDILQNKEVKPVNRKREFDYEGCCSYCGHKLMVHHDRNGYIVYVCQNHKCSYYKDSKKDAKANPDKYKTSSDQFRYRYHYRQFKFNLDEIKKACKKVNSKCDLSRIHVNDAVLGLILTYYINYGLSSRKVASILRDIHGVKLSHQTVMNYADTVSKNVKSFIDYYPYKLGSVLSGDETYVKVKGKQHYVFFFSDPKSKIITSYDINENRDTKCAVTSIHKCISKYDALPEDFTIIADGNPIYNAAQLFLNYVISNLTYIKL